MEKKYYYLVTYVGEAIYEPAEGGYYVKRMVMDDRSYERYAADEIVQAFHEAVEDFTNSHYGKPDIVKVREGYAHWMTGRHVGDDFELYIESEEAVGCHETEYHGYC